MFSPEPNERSQKTAGVKTKYFTASRSEQVWWVEDSRPEFKSYGNLSALLSLGSSKTPETQDVMNL